MNQSLNKVSRLAVLVCSLALLTAYFVPVWQILMWAPQYPEGLEMKIWIDNLTGDVRTISALNHYIGMKHIEVEMFPEFQYMKYIVAGIIAIGLAAALINKRYMLLSFLGVMCLAGVAALVDFFLWGYDYGHDLNPEAPIIIPGMAYQPPLIGTKVLLNFTAFSGPDIGGWIFIIATLVLLSAVVLEWRINRKMVLSLTGIFLFSLTSCSTEPEPLAFGQDACHNCKMTLADHKFGAELVTTKGKIYKFDDLNCFLNFYNQHGQVDTEYAHRLVIDFANPGQLIDAGSAFFVKSESIKSPMSSQLAAFADYEVMTTNKKKWKGIYLSWGEVVTQFK
ncbi:MAG: nitrous oxide reductase accessory protein NosL [Cyclobacteriaceae bacterium]